MAGRRLGLGLDTGGTYTDAAIVDMNTLEVLAKGKSQTTYHDLSVGILGAIDEVLRSDAYDRADIQFVGLSTTLATNSILTGKGGKVGHIGIGWTPMAEYRSGADMDAYIKGGHGVWAQQIAPLDTEALEGSIDKMQAEVDSFVVSGHFSVYNPAHELEAARMIKKRTGLPVVLGHHLTSQLGVPERSVTAVLNARLLPIISDFLDGVERSLKERGIDATILVFKGDGTLMNIEKARERPVETILSGPAASRNLHRHRLSGRRVPAHLQGRRHGRPLEDPRAGDRHLDRGIGRRFPRGVGPAWQLQDRAGARGASVGRLGVKSGNQRENERHQRDELLCSRGKGDHQAVAQGEVGVRVRQGPSHMHPGGDPPRQS